MLDIQIATLNKALTMLKAVGVKYHIVTDEHIVLTNHDFRFAPTNEPKRAKSEFPRGDVLNHYLPYIKDLKVAEVAVIPDGGYGLERVRGGVCSWFSRNVGNSKVVSTINKKDNTVEVLRLE